MVTVTVDAKGRLSIPVEIRDAMDIKPGDVLFLESDTVHEVMHLAKAVNPFNGLAEHAVQEFLAGRTQSLRNYAAENGIELNGE